MGWDYVRDYVITHEVLYPFMILLITVVLAWTTLHLLEGLLQLFHIKSKAFNHKILSVIETPIIIIIIIVGLQLALRNMLAINQEAGAFFMSIVIIVMTYVLSRLGSIILNHWSRRVSHQKGQEFHSEILPLTKSILIIILSLIGTLLVLQVWGVQIGALLTSLGIAGAIVGFAFKETLENVFGGIGLIMDNSFKKGDLIQLEDGELGQIIEINLRSTKFKNFDSEIIIMPNGVLANTKIVNYAQPTTTLRIKIPVSVAYGSDADKVKEVLHNSLRGHKDILTMPRREVRFEGFGESSLKFLLIFFIKNYENMFHIKDDITTQVYKDLYANKIEIPFPIRTIINASPKHYKQKWKNEAVPEDEEPKTKTKTKKRTSKKKKTSSRKKTL